jgi:hypothetical protein
MLGEPLREWTVLQISFDVSRPVCFGKKDLAPAELKISAVFLLFDALYVIRLEDVDLIGAVGVHPDLPAGSSWLPFPTARLLKG